MMAQPRTLSVVIPCLNEAEAIPPVMESITELRRQMAEVYGFESVEVIVVDDSSTDNSRSILSRYPFVHVIRHSETLGYGASLQSGFRRATGSWICFLDMDHTYPVASIPEMWNFLVQENADLVLGRRSYHAEGMSAIRGFGNWLFTQLTRWLFGAGVHDACSGLRIFRRDCLSHALAVQETSLGFSLMMTIAFSRWGLKTREIQIDYKPRKGQSKLSVLKDGLLFMKLILAASVFFRTKKEFRPL